MEKVTIVKEKHRSVRYGIWNVVWLIYTKVMIYIMTYCPLSIMSLILCVIDSRFLSILIVCMLLESCVEQISYYLLQRNCIKGLVDKIQGLSGEIVPIDLELVRKYCKKTIEIDASIFHKDFPPEIIVYRLPCPNLFFTYPIYARTIFIFVKSTFNENERIDRALFAHELGHAFHARFRNKRLLIPFSSCIISVLMLFFAFFFDYWWAFFLVLLGNMYLFYVSFINVEANTETDADLIALKIIESQEGNDAMKNAAYDLIKMRIEIIPISIREKFLWHPSGGFVRF